MTPASKAVMDYVKKLQEQSGLPVEEFAKECGMGRTYWFTRAGYKAPLTITDIVNVCKFVNMTPQDLMMHALAPIDPLAKSALDARNQGKG
ncbi:hypothetical protein G1C94_1437 [Bifidobacterium sp. DSM 109963]|uniref:XRE family transcriptional regulator n=2 Tax=Bifidobacterium panos TaxID=2675321 RepID=A0ABX1SZN9_9BIFI|nr:hypothetical protein [Bifidobacterium sp. DSM 109963]